MFDGRAEKGVISEKQKVVIFETAHPDKFPNSLTFSGLEKATREKHKVLSRLSKLDLKEMGVPNSEKIDLKKVADKIQKLSKQTYTK